MQPRLSSKVYEDLLAKSVDVLTVVDSSGRVTYQSPAVESLLGYAQNELVGDHVFEYVHPDDRPAAAEAFQRIVATGCESTTETLQHRFKHANGSWIWLESRTRAQPTTDIGEYVITCREITALKQRETELKRTQDLLQNTEQLADVAGWTIDTDTQDVFWTEHLFELLRWPDNDEPPLEEALDVYHPEDRPIVEAAVEQALTTGESFDVEARVHRADGALRWFRVQGIPTLDEDGNVDTLRGAVQDITDRKEREQELERSQTIVEASGDPVYTLDETGCFTAVNDALVAFTGYDESTLIGTHSSIVLSDDDVERAKGVIESLLTSERCRETVEMQIHTADGAVIPCETHIALLPSETEFQGTVGVVRDISERIDRKRQLERERDRLAEFASIVSHDLRNPLNVADGRIELAQQECSSEHLAEAAGAVERSLALVDDLLMLARDGDQISASEHVSVGEVVRACWQMVETTEATLVVESDTTVEADRSRLQQLVENLIGNAIDHGGEAVTVTVGVLPDGFYVEDDGPGIPAEQRTDIFEVGYSTGSNGAGFGLNIVRTIAEAHGWTVTVTDSKTGGARFEITGVGN